MQWLDEQTWGRSALLKKYSTYMFPYINLGAEIDVSNLYYFTKKNGISFYCAMIHAVTKIALEIKNFSYRILDGKPVLCDSLTPSFTYLPEGEEQFYVVEVPYEEDMLSFCKKAKEQAMLQATEVEHSFMHGKEHIEILYISCIPWVRYTHFIRTIEKGGEDNIPRISWGKYVKEKDGRIMMPLSVQVHHALMDGYHVGMFFEKMEKYLDSIPES